MFVKKHVDRPFFTMTTSPRNVPLPPPPPQQLCVLTDGRLTFFSRSCIPHSRASPRPRLGTRRRPGASCSVFFYTHHTPHTDRDNTTPPTRPRTALRLQAASAKFPPPFPAVFKQRRTGFLRVFFLVRNFSTHFSRSDRRLWI